jgi:hypothetical protein
VVEKYSLKLRQGLEDKLFAKKDAAAKTQFLVEEAQAS